MMAVDGFWRKKVAGFDFPSLRGGEAHVLAVDDSLVDRKVIERLLKIYSCKVTAVDSGRRALQFLGLDEEMEDGSSVVGDLKVDLIITDYCMPGMTGYELLKKIKESSAFRETPVVIMSSENVLARIDRCLEEGAEDFFVKPVKLSDVERLKEHLTLKDAIAIAKAKTSNKRRQPEDPDLSDSPTSSESPRSVSFLESSPSSDSNPSPPMSPPVQSPECQSRRLKPTASSPDLIIGTDTPL